MSISSETPVETSASRVAGDTYRRRAYLSLAAFAVILPMTVLLFATLDGYWPAIMQLEGVAYFFCALVVGLILASSPVLSAASFLLIVWYGVESVYMPRSRPSPLADKLFLALGLVVWFAPVVAMLGTAIYALITGHIHFPSPARDFFLTDDPRGFWQGIGFLVLGAGLFLFFATRYWRGKLGVRRD